MKKLKLRLCAPLFAAGVAAAGIALAPSAGAQDRSCSATGTATICERDGHSSIITHAPPQRGPISGFGPRGGGGAVYGPFMPPNYPYR